MDEIVTYEEVEPMVLNGLALPPRDGESSRVLIMPPYMSDEPYTLRVITDADDCSQWIDVLISYDTAYDLWDTYPDIMDGTNCWRDEWVQYGGLGEWEDHFQHPTVGDLLGVRIIPCEEDGCSWDAYAYGENSYLYNHAGRY